MGLNESQSLSAAHELPANTITTPTTNSNRIVVIEIANNIENRFDML
ncbi:hypothetical protein DOY81_009000 [Sarcophaga bullata]|nr:hypothetical protein DOY81_009000 [Sarcophaga bullata]